jgi:hypothetical protein
MALVGPGMQSDAIGTEAHTVQGDLHHIRQVAPPRIANQGYFIEVDTELGHGAKQTAKCKTAKYKTAKVDACLDFCGFAVLHFAVLRFYQVLRFNYQLKL